MLFTLTRTDKTHDGIFGHFVIDGNGFKCVTEERLMLCIPAGAYPVQWMWSKNFQQIMPHIIVPDRTAIEMHWANFPQQLDGCIALGTETELASDCIDESKTAWIGFIKAVLNQPNLTLKIVEDFGN